MGGYGSGSYLRWSQKSTTESQHRVDIRWLKQRGYLQPGESGALSWSSRGEKTGSIGFRMEAGRMILNYRLRPRNGDWEDVEQVIDFDRTPCNYGGHRTWLLCPRCRERVAILYGTGKYFLCRRYHDLTYTSQQECRMSRMMSKAQKIRERLGGDASLSRGFPDKPKGMHWRTYRRLRFESERAETISWALMDQKFDLTTKGL